MCSLFYFLKFKRNFFKGANKMNGKSQIFSSLNCLMETEKLNQSDIQFRTSCKDCKFNGKCLLDAHSRMVRKRCYIDAISEKLKIKPDTVVNRVNNFVKKYGIDFSLIASIDKNYWLKMSNMQRMTDIKCNLEYFAQNTNVTVTNEDIKIFLAVTNCYFSAWRDEKYIPCAKCGELIENSKQKNRKYCDRCKNIHSDKKIIRYKTCIDCGCEFEVWHNREVRCVDCQIKANKSASRERAKRYREKKRNGLEKKS